MPTVNFMDVPTATPKTANGVDATVDELFPDEDDEEEETSGQG